MSALSVWAFGSNQKYPKVHILPLWSLSTKHFGFLIAYLSRQKISPHRPPRVDLWVCQGHVQESSHITPGRSDMSSHFVFLPWQWLKTLRPSSFSPYGACSLLYSTCSARRHSRTILQPHALRCMRGSMRSGG